MNYGANKFIVNHTKSLNTYNLCFSVICFPELMSDYYYENDIVPPNIHFKKPFWLKEDKTENNEKEKESKEKLEGPEDKLPTPPNTPISKLMDHPFQEDEFNDKMVIVREGSKGSVRSGRERGRKRRSLSTSFSFLSENRRGIGMDSFVDKQSNIIANIIEENIDFKALSPPTLYKAGANEGMPEKLEPQK